MILLANRDKPGRCLTARRCISPLRLLSLCLLLLCVASCKPISGKNAQSIKLDYPSIIPKPAQIVVTKTWFLLTPETHIVADKTLAPLADYFRDNLGTNFRSIPITASAATDPDANVIRFLLQNDDELGNEGYDLRITGSGIRLAANTPAGIFLGIQTLNQIIPLQTRGDSNESIMLHTANIRDVPRFAWRGTMLDVARHFFSVDDVKKYIDLIAAYKINVLHLHLSDDQGWRLEIKSWPRLATVGGMTQVGGGRGGFYSQDDYREIVRYAQSRFITVVPEIDLPGHVNAALAAYGELSCDGKARQAYTGIEVGFSFLCPDYGPDYGPGKNIAKRFITDVLTEVAQLTPGPFVHIGGDEVKYLSRQEYADFIAHARQVVEQNGKRMIGWEEVVEAEPDGNIIVQHWHSPERINPSKLNQARVVLSPATITYLDMKYDPLSRIGQNWAAFVEVKDTYDWNPATYVNGLDQGLVLGIESALWTETVVNMDDIEFLVFPRLLSLAEVAWTPQENRNWNDFKARLSAQGPRMAAMGIGYHPSPQIPWGRFTNP